MRAVRWWAAAALAVALGACAGDDDGGGAGASPPSTTVPPATVVTQAVPTTIAAVAPTSAPAPATLPPTSPAPPTTGADVEAAIAAALRAYDEAYLAAGAPPVDPDHPALLATTTDGVFRHNIRASLTELKAFGWALRPGPEGHRTVTSLTMDGDKARIEWCQVDDGIVFDPSSGRIVNDDRAINIGTGVLLKSGSVWLVEDLTARDVVVGEEHRCE